MKDITRIHIAKVAYEIELPAKKKLEKYISSLGNYADDPGVLEDIEIRITELLAERKIKSNDVITEDDVTAIQKQLGKPEDFMDSDDAIGGTATHEPVTRHKLFRNTDNAILGGVLSGLATFFGINPLWTRLIFIVIAFASFGIALLAYIVLWLIIPPTRTVADRLQLRGILVTAGTIREFGESQVGLDINERNRKRTQIIGAIIGIIATFGLLVTIAGLIGGLIAWFDHRTIAQFGTQLHLFSLPLVIIDFAFLIIFFGLIAFAGFGQKITKQIIITAGILIILAGVSIGSTFGYGLYSSWQQQQALLAQVKHTDTSLATQFQTARHLTIDAPDVSVNYIISPTPRLDYEALPSSKPVITTDGDMVTITIPQQTGDNVYATPRILTIYGPAITDLTANVSNLTYNATGQNLTLHIVQYSSVTVSGSVDTLSVDLQDGSSLAADGATINDVAAQVTGSSGAQFGTIRNLTLTLPDTCPASSQTTISVQNIVSQHMSVNGETLPSVTHQTPCGQIVVGDLNL